MTFEREERYIVLKITDVLQHLTQLEINQLQLLERNDAGGLSALSDVFGLPVAPKLAELKSRECTPLELQAALVFLIEQYNEQGKRMEAAINRKQDREWQATL